MAARVLVTSKGNRIGPKGAAAGIVVCASTTRVLISTFPLIEAHRHVLSTPWLEAKKWDSLSSMRRYQTAGGHFL
jgi:hypothetical protein